MQHGPLQPFLALLLHALNLDGTEIILQYEKKIHLKEKNSSVTLTKRIDKGSLLSFRWPAISVGRPPVSSLVGAHKVSALFFLFK